MTLLEFEKILKQGESIHTEFKSWIKVSNMRERIALVVEELISFANAKCDRKIK